MAHSITNSKASFDYEILDTYEAGLVLLGHEVKSVRLGRASIGDSFIVIEDGELYLVKSYIAPYQVKNTAPSYDPYRKRKLLIGKNEIRRIMDRKQEAGLTLIPLLLYDKSAVFETQNSACARTQKARQARND